MNTSSDKQKEFWELIDQNRPHEAFKFFIEKIKDTPCSQLPKPQKSMLDVICRRLLPELREQYTLWMVRHPNLLRRMLRLLTEALELNYLRASTVDNIAWLRCLLAIEEALAGRLEHVHEELCLAYDSFQKDSLPKPNGQLHQEIQSIELTERTNVEFLKHFFSSYMQFLHRNGQHDLANHLDSRVGRLLGLIARDEKRPGVIQALFYDKTRTKGHGRFVHVSIERLSVSQQQHPSKEGIEYSRKKKDIDTAMQEASVYTHQVVDAYLKRSGYPDGLDERFVLWEIATVEGDAVELEQKFRGGSVALPLAIAIVSEYLARPVANDIAFTGAFTFASETNGQVLPVDGVPEKVEYAVASGSKIIYIPTGNLSELCVTPALQNLISEHDSHVVPTETLDQVCRELFPPEGSGRLKDLVKDTFSNLKQIIHLASFSQESPPLRQIHHRHRIHIIICSILTAALVFLEGLRLFKVFAPAYPYFAAWTRIIISTVVIVFGMGVSFALPSSCLRHRRTWSWYATIALLAVCFSIAVILIGGMLPDFTHISSIYNAPPVASLIKDLFVIWIFAWAIAANTFNAIAALESLIEKRQFVTARTCLHWDSPLETRMPIRCVHFPWNWGVACIGTVTAFLIVLELNYYSTVDNGTVAGYWEVSLGIVRDMLFIAAIGLVMVFYKVAVARIRRSLN